MKFLSSITDTIGNTLGSNFLDILGTLALLLIGIFVAKFIRNLFIGIFKRSSLNKKLASSNVKVDIPSLLGQLIYYIILLFVILIVLDKMGIQSVLDPLKDLVGKFLGFIPNLLASGIIFYAGWILAKLAQSFVEIATVKLDDWIATKNLDVNVKISKLLSTFVFAIIFIPLAIQGFIVLKFEAISNPATVMLAQFSDVIVRLIVAAAIVGVTYFIAKFVVNLLKSILEGLMINELPAKLGLQSAFPKSVTPVDLVGKIVMFFIMLTSFTTAVDILNIDILSTVFAEILNFGGKLLMGGVIIFIGAALANLAHKKISLAPENKLVASIARFAILGLVLSMGLKAMGLADNIVNMAFGLTLGAVAVAAAVSFGIGGIDAAKTITSSWAAKFKK